MSSPTGPPAPDKTWRRWPGQIRSTTITQSNDRLQHVWRWLWRLQLAVILVCPPVTIITVLIGAPVPEWAQILWPVLTGTFGAAWWYTNKLFRKAHELIGDQAALIDTQRVLIDSQRRTIMRLSGVLRRDTN
jgi:hypothetical protein